MPRAKKSESESKPKPATEIEPTWYNLYRVLADTGDKLLESLTQRSDIPEDAKSILRAVLCLRESKDLFFATGGRLTPKTALMWADELVKWTEERVIAPEQDSLVEVLPDAFPHTES